MLKIAMLGTRGIPASYSGFETCVEQLGQRLVKRGHKVTVYCRSHHITYKGDYYKGMRLVKLPTIKNKYLDTLFHTFLSSFHAINEKFDIGLYFIAGNSPATWILRPFGTKTLLNVDGLDWKREKWPEIARQYIKFSEFLATFLPNIIITDSRIVQNYYKKKFSVTPEYIPYGSEVKIVPPGYFMKKWGLEPEKYILFVGRLVPENNIHHVIEAFIGLKTEYKLVIVGDSSYADDYISRLKKMAEKDSGIVFTGYVFGQGYYELGSNAGIFIESSGVGGTHPALVEAMAFGNCVIVNDTPENLETMGDAGFSYNGKKGGKSLKKVIQELIDKPKLIKTYGKKAQRRAENVYTWEAVTDQYEKIFFKVHGIS